MTCRGQIMQMSDKHSRLLKIYSWANARVHTHVTMEAHFATKKIIGKMIRDTFRYGFSPSHISDSEQKIKNTTHNIRLNFKQNISQVTFPIRIFHTMHFYNHKNFTPGKFYAGDDVSTRKPALWRLLPYLTLTLNIPHIHKAPGAMCTWGIFRVRIRPPRLRVLVPPLR